MSNLAILLFALAVLSGHAFAQIDTAKHGRIERIQVHGKLLEGNLEGDPPDRDVAIYLPPSYARETNRRYPVVYLLHGFTGTQDSWLGEERHLESTLDSAFAQDPAREMIFVMPNAYTKWAGSFYSASPITGNWEDFIAQELVSFVDSHYRTIADRSSRGLAGHSMGGYGTFRIGMKHPDVFSSLYAMSSCCLSPTFTPPSEMQKAEAIHNAEDFAKASFRAKATFASAAAWSPNPERPPFFFDLPTNGGKVRAAVLEQWAANAPLSMAGQYSSNLKRLNALTFDIGLQDILLPINQLLNQRLTQLGVPHHFETYEGTHTNKIGERLEKKVLPFFSSTLSFGSWGGK